MIRIRSFHGSQPLPALDVTTASNTTAAGEAFSRAEEYGGYEDVQVDLGDGSRAMRGAELKAWVDRHFEGLADEAERRCRWFLLCPNEATGTMTHPILGEVPICDRCRAKVEALA